MNRFLALEERAPLRAAALVLSLSWLFVFGGTAAAGVSLPVELLPFLVGSLLVACWAAWPLVRKEAPRG